MFYSKPDVTEIKLMHIRQRTFDYYWLKSGQKWTKNIDFMVNNIWMVA